MYQQPKRNRPRISTTIAAFSNQLLDLVAKQRGLPNPGVAIDYIITDWIYTSPNAPKVSDVVITSGVTTPEHTEIER